MKYQTPLSADLIGTQVTKESFIFCNHQAESFMDRRQIYSAFSAERN